MNRQFKAAVTRYETARLELACATNALRALIVMPHRIATEKNLRPRRSWAESKRLAIRCRELRQVEPELTQRQIGDQLGLTRHLVTYYLSKRCKLG